MRTTLVAAILVLAAMPAWAHRLDEYLQGTLISVEKNRLQAQMTLTPGIAVFPFLMAYIDTNGDSVISETEQRAYAGRVLHDLSLTIDGHRVTPQLLSIRFPTTDDMKEGRGEIQLNFNADLPSGAGIRKLTLENHHQNGISAYQVNCLVPSDPNIKIAKQDRNYTQSFYQLEYTQTDARAGLWIGLIGLLLFVRLMFQWRQHRWPGRSALTYI